MFFGTNTERQKCAVYPQPLSALLFSKLEELLVSQHRNMSFFVSAFDTSVEGKKGGRQGLRRHLLGSDMMLISGSEG